MKKSILFILIFFTVSAFAQTQQAQTTTLKLGWVDSQVILAQLPEAIKANADLEGMASKWRKDLDSMQTDYQKFIADNQKQAETMKKEELQKVQQKLAEKEQKFTQYNQAKFGQPNGEIYKKRDQLLTPVMEKIYKAIDEISKDLGMQFVFNKALEGVLVKADPEFDITYKVLDYLKRGKK
ncbi:MAG: OmpH family outer membrane protein [Melioribacteraceae bacterium]